MDWEIYDGQMQRGPMPEAAVHDAVRGGLPRNVYVRQAGTRDWVPIEQVPSFAAAYAQRGSMGQWSPPPPPPPVAPPPPPMVGAPPPAVPAVIAPPPNVPYAVSSPGAGGRARKVVVARGCLVQLLGVLVVVAAVGLPYANVALAPAILTAAAGLGVVLVLAGGLLGIQRVCSACKQPVGAASICPSCRAMFL